ncbi:hypothetical protein PDG61_07085 [Mycolicibacterium sp. BiH015]|uniref:hypothetical protein n=1 Tax=Mycolicibacterium sp. BiH015 TaxID=3018808 RepID=UPI0022E59EBB|nr:hypothetical protein [Mycolicibacterium sp. BiH015]MDA2890668.1 hypothetical protein [Mycolicibacterium sp. BiH015]
MRSAARTYVTAGVALVGAGVISANPVTSPQLLQHQFDVNVALAAATLACGPGDAGALCGPTDVPSTASSSSTFTPTADSTNVLNIPANLFIALANVPYNVLFAMGEGNVQLGSDPEGDFSFQPTYEGVTLTQPDGNIVGLGRNLRYTGNWWLYSQTNILGTDPADPSRYQAITNILVPFPALSVPLGNMFAAIAASQLPMDVGCSGTGPGACDNVGGILSKMFDLRHIAALFSPEGYTFPTTRAPITCSEDGQCYVKDEDGPEVPWSGETVKLDPAAPFTNFYDSLTETPDVNDIKPVTAEFATENVLSLANGVNTAFNPFVLGTQCAICAPFVPNPENKPIPGPVFEDPDTAESISARDEVPDETLLLPEDKAPTGPKHRKPTATSEAVKNVRDSISSTVSKVTDSFKKATSLGSDKTSDSGSDSTNNDSDS